MDISAKELAPLLTENLANFVKKTGHSKVVIGLSGGIDSAVTACLAVRALGAENIITVAMPNAGITSSESTELAEKLAKNLGTQFHIMPITEMEAGLTNDFFRKFGRYRKIETRENAQSRLRAVVLMAVANDNDAILLSTGNQTEDQLGYFTLYGDGCGAIAPMGHLPKYMVYELAKHINDIGGGLIPEEIITRQPTAELSIGQKDPFDYSTESYLVEEIVQTYESLGLSPDVPLTGPEALGNLAKKHNTTPERVAELVALRAKNAFKMEQSAQPMSLTKGAYKNNEY